MSAPTGQPAAAAFLRGLRVLDLTRLLPGPFLTMILADLGGDVVKIEDPGAGDYMRAFPPAQGGVGARYWAVNRNKRSVALDLKAPAGREVFLGLVERADVVVESFRPGVMDRLGLSYEALRARNPKIVLCSISGYGQTGPYRDRAGHDVNYIALAGALAMGGMVTGAPTLPGVQVADLAGGALWSAVGILAALLGRERTGAGAHLDISMTEGVLALLAPELGALDAGDAPTRGTGMLNGGLACYDVYETKDGRYMAVGALEPKFWEAFNAALGRDGDAAELTAPAPIQRKVHDEIQQILGSKTRAEWIRVFANMDCLCEPVLELDELAAHPLHRARGVFFPLDADAAGIITQVRTPLGAPSQRRRAPQLGEHTQEVLEEYGLLASDIAEVTRRQP